MKSEDDTKKIIDRLHFKVGAKMHDRIWSDVIMTQKQSEKQTSAAPRPNIWKIIMKSKITKYAAAAVIIIVAIIGINYLGGSPDGASVSFANMKTALTQMPFMHETIRTNRDGKEYYTENWWDFGSKSIFAKYHTDGVCVKISLLDYNTFKDTTYEPDTEIVKVVYRSDVSAEFWIESPWHVIEDYISRYEYRGAVIEWEQSHYLSYNVDVYYLMIASNEHQEREEAEFIVNRDNNLPIVLKRKFWTPQGDLRMDQVIQFEFPQSGPGDIYDLGVPRSVAVQIDWDSKNRLDELVKLQEDLQENLPVLEQQFNEIYRLEAGQIIKHIPPSSVEIRRKYYQAKGSIVPDQLFLMFQSNQEQIISKGGAVFTEADIKTIFERMVGLSTFQYHIPEALLSVKIPGDFVVQNGLNKEQLILAFEKVIQDYTQRPIRFEKRRQEREVIVARGQFHFTPLTGTYDDSWIHVFSDVLDPDERGGGGGGSLDEFLTQWLADIQLKQQVVNLTESSDDIVLNYGAHYSGYLGKMPEGAEKDTKLNMLLDNLTRQTSLNFTLEKRLVEIWYVVE